MECKHTPHGCRFIVKILRPQHKLLSLLLLGILLVGISVWGLAWQGADHSHVVYRLGKGINPPKALDTPQPKPAQENPSAPKGKKTKGEVLLLIIVEEDGSVGDVQVSKPWRADVDNNAIAAVKKWRFSPATKDGKPVAVQIPVYVYWTLY